MKIVARASRLHQNADCERARAVYPEPVGICDRLVQAGSLRYDQSAR